VPETAAASRLNPAGRFADLDSAALFPALAHCGRRAGMLRWGLRTGILHKDFKEIKQKEGFHDTHHSIHRLYPAAADT